MKGVWKVLLIAVAINVLLAVIWFASMRSFPPGALGNVGQLTVKIENRSEHPLTNGRFLLDSTDPRKATKLGPPFDAVDAGATVEGSFTDKSGWNVILLYDLGDKRDLMAYCGYPTDFVDVYASLLAEDTLGVDSLTKFFDSGHWESSSPARIQAEYARMSRHGVAKR